VLHNSAQRENVQIIFRDARRRNDGVIRQVAGFTSHNLQEALTPALTFKQRVRVRVLESRGLFEHRV